ncbi:spore coat protein, CotS family [Thermoactinomyces sp. DSM 45891]|uniref:phosphotransferase n=1 Tax=Thermoactinomyces sp. DSM 45891 TaxID=1761907 RepID=UPI0009171951|nr:phosphotransferase [Thermoactinomyces sp. DSM 45891]SFX09039.1 spore coat protein, CotS family [Thermoactinomyces sp. DSM 45891]
MSQPSLRKMERALQTRVIDMEEGQKIWLIYTREQTWVAKQCRSAYHQEWWSQVDRELRHRGFVDMPTFIHAGDGLTLTTYINGETCRYRYRRESKLALEQLARFHQAGRGCTTPSTRRTAFLLWERLGQRLKKFEKYLHQYDRSTSKTDKWMRLAGYEMYQMGINAWNQLYTPTFYEMNEQSHLHHHLCHRDLASHNWMMEGDRAWLIDFDTASYDAQWGDLWQISTRILTENHWDKALWIEMMECYEHHQPLSDWEKYFIKLMYGFPNEFFRESIGVLEKKPGYRLDYTGPYLERIIDDIERWREFLSQLRYW